jgi:hypothetical protein
MSSRVLRVLQKSGRHDSDRQLQTHAVTTLGHILPDLKMHNGTNTARSEARTREEAKVGPE